MGDAQKVEFKILFVTQDDPFYVRLFFEEFLKVYATLNEIRGVVIVQAMGKRSLTQLARQMYDFYGTIDFVRMSARYGAHKLMNAIPLPHGMNGHFSIAGLCRRHGIDVIKTGSINSHPFLEKLRAMDLDLVVSVASPLLFKEDLIRTPRNGCINIHNGKLPKYRGMLPNFWQMYCGEKSIGITVHEINSRLDDGRILLQKDLEIEPEDTLDSLIRRSKRIGAHLVIEAIQAIKQGTVQYKENPASDGSYFSFPTSRDVKEFKMRGKRILPGWKF